MTQKRYWNPGDPFSAVKAREVQLGLNCVGVHKQYPITVVSPDTFQLGAGGFALLPDGIGVTEDSAVTLRINPLPSSATVYTVTARHTETNQSGGAPVLYAAEVGDFAEGSLANGVVLGWIHYPGGGVALTQPMILLASLVGCGGGGSSAGAAGGDLDGTYPDPTVVGIQTTPVSATAPNADGDVLVTASGTYVPTPVSSIIGTGIPSATFNVLGTSGAYITPTNFVDGFREFGVPTAVAKVVMSQEVAGIAGTTSIVLFKVSETGVETQITPNGSLVIPFTAGNKARVVSTTFNVGTESFGANDRLGIKVLSLQTNGEDVSVSVVVASASLPAPTIVSAPTQLVQALDASVFGAVPQIVGSVYVPAGSLLMASTRVVFGAGLPADTARLQLRTSAGSVVWDSTVVGLTTTVAPVGNVTLPAAGFYDWWLWSPSGGAAALRGYRLVWGAPSNLDINYAAASTSMGVTPTIVGSLYLSTGTLQSITTVVLDAFGPGAPTATLEIVRPDTTVLATFVTSGAGGREAIAIAAPTLVTIADFHTLRIYGDAATTGVSFLGMRAQVTP